MMQISILTRFRDVMCPCILADENTYATGTTGTHFGGGGLYPGGFISGIISSLANGWAYIRGGGL